MRPRAADARERVCLEDLVALGREQLSAVQHGPSVGDEVNLVTAGGNYGWDPQRGYDASVPMTDLQQFAAAIEAKCSSSDPALATATASSSRVRPGDSTTRTTTRELPSAEGSGRLRSSRGRTSVAAYPAQGAKLPHGTG